jgi:methylenetetrahydrofolate dehydrogenase (NADP+) / methenyltetrahydrofolate cyclohydrolase
MPTPTPGSGARVIDGVALAQTFRAAIADRVRGVKAMGRAVRLDAVLVGDTDNAARIYAANQAKTCEAMGIEYRLHELRAGATYDDIAGRVLLLNTEEKVTAIMVHLPMPEGVDPYRIQRLIAPEKDVEGVNPANIGNVVYGRSSLAPCTALAVVKMVESIMPEFDSAWRASTPMLRGKVCVVVGAGDTVGKPIAVLLMRHEGTIVSCNKFTPGLKELARSADILVAAAGVPGLVTADMVKPGAVVIDVGVNRVKDAAGKVKTVGDVAFDEVKKVAGWVSPVPGGVGPVTVAMLLLNVVEAAER